MKRAAELALRVVASAPGAASAVVLLDRAFAGFVGHFPGAPVLPGMCHVDLAVRVASRAMGAPLDLVAVERAKFVRRALPGEELTIRLALDDTGGATTAVAADHSVGGEPCAELLLIVRRRA